LDIAKIFVRNVPVKDSSSYIDFRRLLLFIEASYRQ
jgi:hypothetical protein